MANKKTPTADYEVGYAKTPVSTRFQKGQSGHPGGRKKGSRNFKTIFREAMATTVELTEPGQQRSVDATTAVILSAIRDALKGHRKTRADLLDRCERNLSDPDAPDQESSEEDEAAIEAALRRRQRDDGSDHA
jgi:hypothetical protein